jgi:predicted nucleic acid-binding protein
MSFVLDASMTMSRGIDDEASPETEAALEELVASYAEVPSLWAYEIANSLASSIRRGRMSLVQAERFVERLRQLDIRVEERNHLATGLQILPFAAQRGLTAYDAAYLELARRRGLPIATLDKRLIAAAPLEGVRILGQMP